MIIAVSLSDVVAPELPLWELLLRGTLTYLFLLGLMRFVQKRQAGTLGVADLLFVLLIAHAAHNALVGEYHSLTDGAILTTTVLALNMGINWLGFHVPAVGRLIHPPPLELIKDGQENWANMRREFITRDELLSHVRRAGAEDISDVRGAWMEGNGQISVVTTSDQQAPAEERQAL
jgi:uncharacterized membrane protein YcaP (DUF421 family)